MNTIDALKRLERAGAENSRATKRLHYAAREVAAMIKHAVTAGVPLPRGYKKISVESNVGYMYFLARDAGENVEYIDGLGVHLHRDFKAWIPGQTRKGSLQFAKDVAEGLLDEIAEFIEQRQAEAETAANALERATA